MKVLLLIIVSYLLGCFSISITLSKSLYKKDVRDCGSGNAGATNMARNFGWKMGVLTVLSDVAKAALAMILGKYLMGNTGICISGAASIIGHCYPVFYGFSGGKGVSVGAAIAFFISPAVGFAAVAAFLLAALLSKKVSLGSLCAAVTVFAVTFLTTDDPPKRILALICMLLVVIRHSENIKRLINHTEPDFKFGKAK